MTTMTMIYQTPKAIGRRSYIEESHDSNQLSPPLFKKRKYDTSYSSIILQVPMSKHHDSACLPLIPNNLSGRMASSETDRIAVPRVNLERRSTPTNRRPSSLYQSGTQSDSMFLPIESIFSFDDLGSK
jgi:hypothetical protein